MKWPVLKMPEYLISNKMQKEIQYFLTAVMFYTRIPCPSWVDHSEHYLLKSRKYFPLIGVKVGGIAGLVLWGSMFLFPIEISVLLSMVVSILMTGAFHEDGLADTCDGFGGGWSKEKILLIMKDSRIGTYGVVGLVLTLLLKFFLLTHAAEILGFSIIYLLIAGHSLSRFVALTFFITHPYAKANDTIDSKSKPLAMEKLSLWDLIVASLFGILPLLLFQNYIVFALIIPMLMMKWYLGRKFNKWIGGYTGDCLGATQQICEVVFYLGLLGIWKFI